MRSGYRSNGVLREKTDFISQTAKLVACATDKYGNIVAPKPSRDEDRLVRYQYLLERVAHRGILGGSPRNSEQCRILGRKSLRVELKIRRDMDFVLTGGANKYGRLQFRNLTLNGIEKLFDGGFHGPYF